MSTRGIYIIKESWEVSDTREKETRGNGVRLFGRIIENVISNGMLRSLREQGEGNYRCYSY